MLKKIALSRDRTKATIHYDNRSVAISDDRGQVETLIMHIITDQVEAEREQLEKTVQIDLKELEDESN